jgi:hypothetical protein
MAMPLGSNKKMQSEKCKMQRSKFPEAAFAAFSF